MSNGIDNIPEIEEVSFQDVNMGNLSELYGKSSEEIAGYFYDLQIPLIAEDSPYYEDREAFIADYKNQFKAFEDTEFSTALERSENQLMGAFEDMESVTSDWREESIERVQRFGKWWETDREDDFYSKAELLQDQTEALNRSDDKLKDAEIQSAISDYKETKEVTDFKAAKTGIRTNDSIRDELWSHVSDVKRKFSDSKKNRLKSTERTIKNANRQKDAMINELTSNVLGKSQKLVHAGENSDLDRISTSQEKLNNFGGELWNTMSRIISTGIFDKDIEEINANPSKNCELDNSCGSCFHPTTTVELEDGSIKTMKEVNYGDKVKAVDKEGNIIYSEVWEDKYFNYKDETGPKYYITITAGDKTIKLTTMHTIFIDTLKKNINAHNVKPGMYINVLEEGSIVRRMVDSVIHSVDYGKYDLYTREGTVIANGIMTGTLAFWPHKFAQWWHKFFNKHPKLYAFAFKYIYDPIFNFYYPIEKEHNLKEARNYAR